MTQAGPLAWRTGAGWLVLVGSGRRACADWDQLDAAVLGWSIPGRPIAVLLADGGESAEAEIVLDCWSELGGSSGYVVDLRGVPEVPQEEHSRLIAEAGLVYLADVASPLALLDALVGGPMLDAVGAAFDAGAPVIAAGSAAAAMGAWVAGRSDRVPDEIGLGWLPNAIVAPEFSGAERAAPLRRLLNSHVNCLGLGVPGGGALALGPTGRVEMLGSSDVTVVVSRRGSE